MGMEAKRKNILLIEYVPKTELRLYTCSLSWYFRLCHYVFLSVIPSAQKCARPVTSLQDSSLPLNSHSAAKPPRACVATDATDIDRQQLARR